MFTFNTPDVGSNPNIHILAFLHTVYCVWRHTASFGSGMKTASAAPFWHLPVPGGTARWRMQAVWWLVWPKLFGPGARAIVEGWTKSSMTAEWSSSTILYAVVLLSVHVTQCPVSFKGPRTKLLPLKLPACLSSMECQSHPVL